MTASPRNFALVGEEEIGETPAPRTDAEAAARNTQLLLLSLRVVSQRAVTAISHLFTAGMVGSALLLWWTVLPAPTVLQLVGLGMWGCFVLAIEWIRKGR